MANILLEGFDHEATRGYGGSGNNLAQKGWVIADTQAYVPGRFPWAAWSRGIAAAFIDNEMSKVLPSTYTELICGFGVRITGGNDKQFFNFGGAGGVGIDSLNRLTLIDSLGAVVATGTHQLNHDVWYYIEIRIDCSGGEAEVHFNGFPEIASTSGDFDTSIGYVKWVWQYVGAAMVQVDDVYVNDTTGGVNDTFWGDMVVQTFFPVADGSYTDFTPKTGTDHYPMVDETSFDGEATYVYDNNVGDKDSYSVGPALADTTIYSVQLNLAARKQDAGSRAAKALILQSGTDYLSSAYPLSTDWAIYTWILDKDPAGATWLYTTVNSDEYGIKVDT